MKLSRKITNNSMVARKSNNIPMTVPCDDKDFILISRRGKNSKRMMKIVYPRKVESTQSFGVNMGLYNVKVKKHACGPKMNVQVKNDNDKYKKRSVKIAGNTKNMKFAKNDETDVNNMTLDAIVRAVMKEMRTIDNKNKITKEEPDIGARNASAMGRSSKSNFKFDEERFTRNMQELTKHMQNHNVHDESTKLTEINRFIIQIKKNVNDLQSFINCRKIQECPQLKWSRQKLKDIKINNYKNILKTRKHARLKKDHQFNSNIHHERKAKKHVLSEYAFSSTTVSSELPSHVDKETDNEVEESNTDANNPVGINDEHSCLSDEVPNNQNAQQELDQLKQLLLTVKNKPDNELNEYEKNFKEYIEGIEKEKSDDLNDGDYEMKQHIKDLNDSFNNYKLTSSDDTLEDGNGKDNGNENEDKEAREYGFKFRQNIIQKHIHSLNKYTSKCNEDILDNEALQMVDKLSIKITNLAHDGLKRYREDLKQYYFKDVLEYVGEAVQLANKGQFNAKRLAKINESEKDYQKYRIDRKHHIKINAKFKELEKEVLNSYENEIFQAHSNTLVHENENIRDHFSPVQVSTTKSKKQSAGAGGNGGDDDDSSDSDNSKNRKHNNSDYNKRKRTRKHKKRKDSSSSFDSFASNLSEKSINDIDKTYRSILKGLLKTAKNFCIKELSLSSDPRQKRERFLNWVVDIKSVLSCDYRTAGLLDSYPSSLEPFKDDVDKAIRGLLISTTKGAARDLITRATTGFDGLIDLRRNCAQSTIIDEHRERRKMLNMKQSVGERASEFLYRIRKQILACQSAGCLEFDTRNDNNVMTSIVLEGLDSHNQYYAATIAEQKASFRKDPNSVSLITLEEILFAMDDQREQRRSQHTRKKEHANYIKGSDTDKRIVCHHCKLPGHKKPECPKLKGKMNQSRANSQNYNRKQDLSNVKCYNCNEVGHYARNCPKTNQTITKKVVFESAHVAKKHDESCNLSLESAHHVFETTMQTTYFQHSNINSPYIFAQGDFAKWLLDSGASSHFTPFLSDLISPVRLQPPIYIQVADGTQLRATHQGAVELNYISDSNQQVCLRLKRVLYVPGLKTRLFSIESFISSGNCTALYKNGSVTLTIPNQIAVTIPLPHVPPGTFTSNEVVNFTASSTPEYGFHTRFCDTFVMMARENVAENLIDIDRFDPKNKDPCSGGEPRNIFLPSSWHKHKQLPKSRMNVELAHDIFGHRAISSLLNASREDVWDDLTLVMVGDSYCDSCKIAFAKRNPMSKRPMRFGNVPLQNMFVDLIPSPGILRGIPSCSAKNFLFLVDPVSKFIEKLNVSAKTTEATIEALQNWRNEMVKKDFELFVFLRSDAGTNFTSPVFKQWCIDNHIQLSIAGVEHQEQNAFAESAYKTASYMARSMLVHARMPITFFHLALDYAIRILRVLPSKNLTDDEGTLTTPYQIIYGKKPRVTRFKVFGCPCTFKRYEPTKEGNKNTKFKTLQQASRGIFVGFPKDQAGWLIYSAVKLNGSHLVVCSDVAFDQHFLSGVVGTETPYKGALPERNVGKVGGCQGKASERTGDITNLTDTTVSHWGDHVTYDTSTPFSLDNINYTSSSINKNDTNLNMDDDGDDNSLPELIENYDEDSDDDDTDDENDTGSEHSDDFFNTTVYDSDFEDEVDHRYPTRSRTTNRKLNAQEVSQSESMNLATCIDSTHNKQHSLQTYCFNVALSESKQALNLLEKVTSETDTPIDPYLPEPRNLREIRGLPIEIQKEWFKTVAKEVKTVIENDTLIEEQPLNGDEIIPAIFVFKAKITSKGFLDKLKARLVARGDLQIKSEDRDALWSPCVFARTFKMFVARAVKCNRPIKQLDFVAAFCQGAMKARLFLQLPKDFAQYVDPQFQKYFDKPFLLNKSIYGLNIAAKSWNDDLTEWLIKEKDTVEEGYKFIQSQVDPSLFIYRNGDDYLFLCCYVDDTCYFGSSDKIESTFEQAIMKRFNLELQGWSHWFLGTRIYREEDGSYIMDQENYIKHLLNRYCSKESAWGLPPMKDTPAPTNYVYSKDNRPSNEKETKEIEGIYPNLSMPSAVSSLLYAALNTRPDILWITNKLAKSANYPGKKDFEALLHVFGYLRKYSDYGIKFYANLQESPVHQICFNNNIHPTDIICFSDSSWQDCPDTGRSTCGYKIFVQGGLIDAQSTLPVPVALNSAEAEYMGACNGGAMICHLRDIQYDFDKLGMTDYDTDYENNDTPPSLLLTDNDATVRMSKNNKNTSKNRHIRRRWHFVRYGVKKLLFSLKWITKNDQLADDMTKTQISSKSKPHFDRTLFKIPDKVKGYKSNTVGNR